MTPEIIMETIGGKINSYYPIIIEELFSIQTIKDGKSCNILSLYGKEVSAEEFKEFLEKHKP